MCAPSVPRKTQEAAAHLPPDKKAVLFGAATGIEKDTADPVDEDEAEANRDWRDHRQYRRIRILLTVSERVCLLLISSDRCALRAQACAVREPCGGRQHFEMFNVGVVVKSVMLVHPSLSFHLVIFLIPFETGIRACTRAASEGCPSSPPDGSWNQEQKTCAQGERSIERRRRTNCVIGLTGLRCLCRLLSAPCGLVTCRAPQVILVVSKIVESSHNITSRFTYGRRVVDAGEQPTQEFRCVI